MFVRGNSKLGDAVWSWAIPAGKTCPGKSELCIAHCYAKKGNFLRSNVSESHRKNWAKAKTRKFVPAAIAEIRRKQIRTLRIHAAGDFDRVRYIRDWLEIVKACPQTRFYAYTRSWRKPELRKELLRLAREPNFSLWFSADRETGAPPKTQNTRRAYMAVSDEDVARFPVDLVFRVSRKTIQKFDAKDRLVCPAENGVTRTTCTVCRLCISRRAIPQRKRHGL